MGWCALVGAGYGACGSLTNHGTGWFWHALSITIGLGVSWAVFAICVGAFLARRQPLRVATGGATVALLIAVPVYYAVDHAFAWQNYLEFKDRVLPPGGMALGPPSFDTGEAVFWSVAALGLGPVLGLLGARLGRSVIRVSGG